MTTIGGGEGCLEDAPDSQDSAPPLPPLQRLPTAILTAPLALVGFARSCHQAVQRI